VIKNKIRELWTDGKPVINGWLSTSSPFVAEIMAAQGDDVPVIDCQHGFVAYEAAAGMLQAMSASGVPPMVRVPWLDPGDILKSLDAGTAQHSVSNARKLIGDAPSKNVEKSSNGY
jgi:4-hydroxy-2-oxoheptanedioate aldolase